MKKIFITRDIAESGIAMLKNAGYEVTVSSHERPLVKKELLKIFKKNKYDGVVTLLSDPIDSDVIASMNGIKVISNYAVGFNNIDIKAAEKNNIVVCNTRASSGYIVAEHAMALLLGLSSRISFFDRYVKKGKYKGWDPLLLRGESLRGKTIGIIGSGDIGGHFAYMCKMAHGMQVLYFDIKKNEKIEKDLNALYISSVEELLTLSDVVSLHVPLNSATHHLIDEKKMALMKRSSILINTSRGPVVDEKALVKALKRGIIGGAGLDVFEFEPKLVSGLAKLDNVILTPHIASATLENREEMSKIACKNIIDVLENRHCDNIIKVPNS